MGGEGEPAAVASGHQRKEQTEEVLLLEALVEQQAAPGERGEGMPQALPQPFFSPAGEQVLALVDHRGDPPFGEVGRRGHREVRQRQRRAAEHTLLEQPVAEPRPRLAGLAQRGVRPQGERRVFEPFQQSGRQHQRMHHHPVEGAAALAVQEAPGERPGAARQRMVGEEGAFLGQQMQVVGHQRLLRQLLGVGPGEAGRVGDQRITAGRAGQRIGHQRLGDLAKEDLTPLPPSPGRRGG
jgi:hypothetical protein